MNKHIKGFTLIEMVVVITVIGFLAAGVLASVNFLRARAKDSRIQATVQEAISVVETFYNVQNDTYTDPQPSDAWKGLSQRVKTQQGGDGEEGLVIEGVGESDVAVFAHLSGDESTYYCVDTNGKAVAVTSKPDSGNCP